MMTFVVKICFAPNARSVILAPKTIPWDIDYFFKALVATLSLVTIIEKIGTYVYWLRSQNGNKAWGLLP